MNSRSQWGIILAGGDGARLRSTSPRWGGSGWSCSPRWPCATSSPVVA